MRKQKIKPRRKPSKSERYKVTNWPEYNRSLKERGNLKLWISAETIDNWYYSGVKEKGGQYDYSEACIETCLSIKILFKLGYRQTQGFLESIFGLAKIDKVVPNYSVMCQRCKKLDIKKKISEKEKDRIKMGCMFQQTVPA